MVGLSLVSTGVPPVAYDEHSPQYIWVERERGPLGERQWSMVQRTHSEETAREVGKALESAGHTVYIRHGNAKYPGT